MSTRAKMAGSKKGEKRGAAGRARNTELGVEKPHVEKKPQMPRGVGQRGPDRRTEDYMRQVVRMVNPEYANDVEPREFMLKVMRYADHKGNEAMAEKEALIEEMADRVNRGIPTNWAEYDLRLAHIESRINSYWAAGMDAAFKVAPYLHPRLSAIAVAPATGSASNIMSRLFQEIEQLGRGKPSWQMGEVLELPAPDRGDDDAHS